jgi:hypothetical protein
VAVEHATTRGDRIRGVDDLRPGEVRVQVVDPGVDDRDFDAGACRDVPRGRRTDLRQK